MRNVIDNAMLVIDREIWFQFAMRNVIAEYVERLLTTHETRFQFAMRNVIVIGIGGSYLTPKFQFAMRNVIEG